MGLKIRRILFIAVLASLPIFTLSAIEKISHDSAKHESSAFNLGEFIFEHIGDSYSWHIASYKEHQIAIPLPIIVYSKTSGIHIFMSNKFHHGHAEYQGFKIAKEGPSKGKIVEIMPNSSEIKPFDISITKDVATLLISAFSLLWIFLFVSNKYKKNPDKAPSGLQNAVEPFILFIRDDIAKPMIGDKYDKFVPYLLTLFFFIWFNNMLGLIPIFPGGANLTGNIAVTMVMALFTFVLTTINGNKHYWRELYDAPGVPLWLKIPIPLMPFVEIIGVFTKPFVLMVRLFANITAGHIIILGLFSIIFIFGQMSAVVGWAITPITLVFALFMSLIELLIALIQAYVFTLLSALYFGMAMAEHHEKH